MSLPMNSDRSNRAPRLRSHALVQSSSELALHLRRWNGGDARCCCLKSLTFSSSDRFILTSVELTCKTTGPLPPPVVIVRPSPVPLALLPVEDEGSLCWSGNKEAVPAPRMPSPVSAFRETTRNTEHRRHRWGLSSAQQRGGHSALKQPIRVHGDPSDACVLRSAV